MATKIADRADVPALSFLGFIHEGVPVATENLDACIEFYIEVLGLKLLPRPKALDDLGPGRMARRRGRYRPVPPDRQ